MSTPFRPHPPSRDAATKVFALLSYDLVQFDECVSWARSARGDVPRWVQRLADSKGPTSAMYALRKKVRTIPPAVLLPCMWLAYTRGRYSLHTMLQNVLHELAGLD